MSGIQYANLDTPETLPTGPSGIFSVKEGFAITDNVGGRIVLLNHDFGMMRAIDVSRHAQGITAVVQDGDDLVALDGYSQTPKLLRVGADGNIWSKDIVFSHKTGPTGLVHDDLGQILEFDNGGLLYQVNDLGTSLELTPTEGYVWNGVRYSVDFPKTTFVHERTVRIGSSSGTVRVPNMLGSVQLIGSDEKGGVFALVEDAELSQAINVELSIWHFSSSGEALSVAKVPLVERGTAVQHGIVLNKNTEPVALVTQRNGLQFWGLTQTNSSAISARQPTQLPVEAKKESGLGTTVQGLTSYNGSCLSFWDMYTNMNEYLNVSVNMTAANINNNSSCQRVKPSYLGSPGWYSSVSYDWGGNNTPSEFISAMSSGKVAGNNTDLGGGLDCSYGVDCSGFVGRVWGFTDKKSTITLTYSNVSVPVTTSLYSSFDALDLSGHHVVLFFGFNSNNALDVAESVGDAARVVFRSRTMQDSQGIRLIEA